MNNPDAPIIYTIDRSTTFTILIANCKAFRALVKYLNAISSSIVFFMSQDRVIIRADDETVFTSSDFMPRSFLEYKLTFSDNIMDKIDADTDISNVFVQMTLKPNALFKSMTNVSKISTLRLTKVGKLINVNVGESGMVNTITYISHNNHFDIGMENIDIESYEHVITCPIIAITSSIKGLKSFLPDTSAVIHYSAQEHTFNIMVRSGKQSGIARLGNNNITDESSSLTLLLSQLSTLINLKDIVDSGVMIIYVSEQYKSIMIVMAIADMGDLTIYLSSRKEDLIEE